MKSTIQSECIRAVRRAIYGGCAKGYCAGAQRAIAPGRKGLTSDGERAKILARGPKKPLIGGVLDYSGNWKVPRDSFS